MSKRRKDKVSTQGDSCTLENNPFAALQVDHLAAAPDGGQARAKAVPPKPKAKSKGRVEVRREKAGRGGKTVTTLSAFASQIGLKELELLTFDLKKTCACGGTLKQRSIELQGDVTERVRVELEKLGYQPVRAGG